MFERKRERKRMFAYARRLSVALLACVFASSLVAHAETRPGYAGRIEGSLLGEPATLDPVSARTHAELTVVGLVFDNLYRIELASGRIEPRLAAGPPEPTSVPTIVRVPLRKGVLFHDGNALTAADVVASLDRARKGAGKWALAGIARVRSRGDAVEITVRSASLVRDLATTLALPPAAITREGKAPGVRPIGTGPFELESFDRANHRLSLKAFEDHFAGRTYLDRVTLHWYDKPDAEAKRFETDRLQLSARGAAAFIGGQPKYKAGAVDGPKSILLYVGFGRRHASVLHEIAFRRALDFALERGALTSVNKGESVLPAGDPVPVEVGGHAPTQAVRTGDLRKARAALADAARRVPALSPTAISRLVLEIAFENTRPDDRQIAERISRALGKLGIGATLMPMSATDLRARVLRGAVDLYVGQLALQLDRRLWWAWLAAAFDAGGQGWGAQLAAGQLSRTAARTQFERWRPILPLMFRGVRMWHRGDLRGLRFDAMGRPCLEDVFLFGRPSRTGTP